VLKIGKSSLGGLGRKLHGLGRSAGLGGSDGFCVSAVTVDKPMATSTTLDLPKAHQVATLEAPVAVLELPQSAVGVSSMENISLYRQ
jgi:hypothetical protein